MADAKTQTAKNLTEAVPKVAQTVWDGLARFSDKQLIGNSTLQRTLTARLERNPVEINCIIQFLEKNQDPSRPLLATLDETIRLLTAVKRTNALNRLYDYAKANEKLSGTGMGPITSFLANIVSSSAGEFITNILKESPPSINGVKIVHYKFNAAHGIPPGKLPRSDAAEWLEKIITEKTNPIAVKEVAISALLPLDSKAAERIYQSFQLTKEGIVESVNIAGNFLARGEHTQLAKMVSYNIPKQVTFSNSDIENALTTESKFGAYIMLRNCHEPLSEVAQAGLMQLARRGGFSPSIAARNALAWAQNIKPNNKDEEAKFLIEIGSLYGIGKEARQEVALALSKYPASVLGRNLTEDALNANPQKAETIILALLDKSRPAAGNEADTRQAITLIKHARPEFINEIEKNLSHLKIPVDLAASYLENSRFFSGSGRAAIIQAFEKQLTSDDPDFKEVMNRFFKADGKIITAKQFEEAHLRMFSGQFVSFPTLKSALSQKETAAATLSSLIRLETYPTLELSTTGYYTIRDAAKFGYCDKSIEPTVIRLGLTRVEDFDRLKSLAYSANTKAAGAAIKNLAYYSTPETKAFLDRSFADLPKENQIEYFKLELNQTTANKFRPHLEELAKNKTYQRVAVYELSLIDDFRPQILNNEDYKGSILTEIVSSNYYSKTFTDSLKTDPKYNYISEYLEQKEPKKVEALLKVLENVPEKYKLEATALAYYTANRQIPQNPAFVETLIKGSPAFSEEKLQKHLVDIDPERPWIGNWAIRKLSKSNPEFLMLAAQRLVDYYKDEPGHKSREITPAEFETALAEAAKAKNLPISSLLKSLIPESEEGKKLIALYERAEKVKTHLPLRIPYEYRELCLRNLENPNPVTLPDEKITLMVVTRGDHNLAFYQRMKAYFNSHAKPGHRIIWRETEDAEKEFHNVFSDPQFKDSDLTVIIGGHGSHTNFNFSAISGKDNSFTRAVSEKLGRLDTLTQAKKLRVLMESCLTGAYEDYEAPITYSLRKNNFPTAEFISAPINSPSSESVTVRPGQDTAIGVVYQKDTENEHQTD